jgi:hypothetical protein
MRRLNVRFSQIEECIRTSMFAVDMLPKNPPLERGEPLLLQLVLEDAKVQGLLNKRIQFALIFDRAQRDTTGAISREHWPSAGKTWNYILFCSETVTCVPFTLDQLKLSRNYGGQTNPVYIQPQDEARIRPYLQGGSPPGRLFELTSVEGLLSAIRNHDRIVTLEPQAREEVHEHARHRNDPWLGNALKELYDHHCQICLNDFKPRYGIPYADTLFLRSLDQGGLPVSRNLIVICPNHRAIIGAAHANYRPRDMAFHYPNGLVEKVRLRDHLFN